MSGGAEGELTPEVASNLARLGWSAADVAADAALPVAARGANLVTAIPPAVAWSDPLLATLLSRLAASDGRLLLLSPPELLAEWGRTLSRLAEGTPLDSFVATGAKRAERRIEQAPPRILVATPAAALALQARSALHAEAITAVLFAWPERWQDEAALAALAADLPRDAQRVVITSDAAAVTAPGAIAERYLHRAPLFGVTAAAGPHGPVRTLSAAWSTRAAAVASAVEALDSDAALVWTTDARDHVMIADALGGALRRLDIVVRSTPDAASLAPGATILCYDPPDEPALAALCAAGPVVLLVPPGTEPYLTRVAAPRRPLAVLPALAAEFRNDAERRERIAALAAAGPESGAFYALAPLFEMHEPSLVAAALWQLWRASDEGRPAGPAPAVAPTAAGETTRVWVSAGRRDGTTTADLVAVLVREAKVDRALIGRIELRDTFSLVEVPAADADRIARELAGKTIRRRKLAARIDRGRTARR